MDGQTQTELGMEETQAELKHRLTRIAGIDADYLSSATLSTRLQLLDLVPLEARSRAERDLERHVKTAHEAARQAEESAAVVRARELRVEEQQVRAHQSHIIGTAGHRPCLPAFSRSRDAIASKLSLPTCDRKYVAPQPC